MTILLLSITIAVVVSFLCSVAEAVLLSLSPVRLQTLKQQGKRYAGAWLDMKKNVDRPIAAILILNTIAHTGGATIAGSAFDSIYGDQWIWVFSIIFTFIILIGTEIMPKVIGVTYSHRIAPILAAPLQATIFLLRPLIFFTEMLSRVLRGGAHGHANSEVEAADLITLAKLARSRSLIDSAQEQIIIQATKLRETPVSETMVPADEIIFFDLNKTTEENLATARQSLHTRYPVSETGRLDDVVGYVNSKEILALAPDEREETLHHYFRRVLFVKPADKLIVVLKNLISGKRHLAIVKDEENHVLGLLTLEDILEEIVGDIEDEFDVAAKDLVAAGRGAWKVGGGVSAESLEALSGHSLDCLSSLKIADLITERIDPPLKVGQRLRQGDFQLSILQIRRGQPHMVMAEYMAR